MTEFPHYHLCDKCYAFAECSIEACKPPQNLYMAWCRNCQEYRVILVAKDPPVKHS